MRTLRIVMLIAVAAMMFMMMTGISSCRGSASVYEGLYIWETQNDYYLEWQEEGWDWGQMDANIIDHEPVTASYGDPVPLALLTWHISDPSVLSINSNGNVIAQAEGYVSVYATYWTGMNTLTSNVVYFTVEEGPEQLSVLSVEIVEDYIVDSVHETSEQSYDHYMEYYEYSCFRAIATFSDLSTLDVTTFAPTKWSLDSMGECLVQDTETPWCVHYPGYGASSVIQQVIDPICVDEITVEYTYEGKTVSDTDTIAVFEGYQGE